MKSKKALASNVQLSIVGMGASAGGLAALAQLFTHASPTAGLAFVIVQHLDPHRAGLPIDFFFKSLADDRQQNSIGVVLSGMGSDGTQGLRAIRQVAGACFVQTPTTAQFDNMPRSAIDAGVADVVAPADELPGKILAYVNRVQLDAQVAAKSRDVVAQKEAGFLEKIIAVLRSQTGHDFSLYKKNTIARRVERRMGLHQLTKITDYLRYLRENSQESELLFNELLIGVTSFFRDAAMWEQLKTEIIPVLLANHPDGAVLRAWVPGCSTGEEAYSGIYARSIAAEVSEKRLNRFFVEDAGRYRIGNEIREMVVFAEQNIIVDPPFTKVDLVSCRNLLIYLESALQSKLIQLFYYSLNSGGVLVLGSAESIGSATRLFSPWPGKARIYRRLDAPERVLVTNQGDMHIATPRRRKARGAGEQVVGSGTPLEAVIQQLQQAREEAKSIREEMQTSQEELKSTNEEFQSKVRIMPYRTQENRIDGLVITFTDITTSKKLEVELTAARAQLAALTKNLKHEAVNDGLS